MRAALPSKDNRDLTACPLGSLRTDQWKPTKSSRELPPSSTPPSPTWPSANHTSHAPPSDKQTTASSHPAQDPPSVFPEQRSTSPIFMDLGRLMIRCTRIWRARMRDCESTIYGVRGLRQLLGVVVVGDVIVWKPRRYEILSGGTELSYD